MDCKFEIWGSFEKTGCCDKSSRSEIGLNEKICFEISICHVYHCIIHFYYSLPLMLSTSEFPWACEHDIYSIPSVILKTTYPNVLMFYRIWTNSVCQVVKANIQGTKTISRLLLSVLLAIDTLVNVYLVFSTILIVYLLPWILKLNDIGFVLMNMFGSWTYQPSSQPVATHV